VTWHRNVVTRRPISRPPLGAWACGELIRLRVREEVARYNARPTERFHGLVRPIAAEEDLNGYCLCTPSRIDYTTFVPAWRS
jgi:hypothetical protein